MNIIILAAGMGKRMQSTIPKVLHPIAQKSMLHHVIDSVLELQPHKIFIVVGHGAKQVQESIEKKYLNQDSNYSKIHFIIQEQQLGTGHAVMQVLPYINNTYPSLVLYGDVPLIQTQTLKNLIQERNDAVGILTAFYENPKGYGRIIKDEQQHIIGIVEEKDASAEQKTICEINTGIMCLPSAYLHTWLPSLKNNNVQQEYYLTDIVTCAVKDNIGVKSMQPQYGNWETIGVNSKQQLHDLERLHQTILAQNLLEQGATLIDAARIDIRGTLTIEQDVTIDVGCVFEGNVHLAKGVHIEAYCVIRNTSIDAYTTIYAFSHIDQSIIGAYNKIGPYARLRPNNNLAAHVKIGNFVELKNTQIDEASKISHLSYVGDATLGKNVNIGAGVITCNYDGKNKHHTHIEAGAFIGSDCQLVAPVRVGQDAIIAAGTTLTKNAPENSLTLSRVKQTSIEDWVKKK